MILTACLRPLVTLRHAAAASFAHLPRPRPRSFVRMLDSQRWCFTRTLDGSPRSRHDARVQNMSNVPGSTISRPTNPTRVITALDTLLIMPVRKRYKFALGGPIVAPPKFGAAQV
ncbi:hypothetical protein BV22DRAFT_927835 [Leucogyrophana mollusca]|uniref:Uncharacterized protein n=1 Tax=Leucogyrophana mollusca TaxID=85980 RepID=A0ACB8AZE6_9AGAM|nr:hypothetical protein BV22DRAFT_927835 [Leucogyrophana mollusca]